MRYFALLLLLLSFASCASSPQPKLSTHCVAHNGLPDKRCTPGAIFPNATVAQICTPGYTRTVRNVSQSTKNKVYLEYGITSHVTGAYEVDHLIPLEIGGSNDIKNLWPEIAVPKPGFKEKDKIENYLHDQVCKGNKRLKDAQNEIADNWELIVVS